MAYAEVNGLSMYHEVRGEGDTPLVLLPGGLLTIEGSFGDVLEPLSRGRRVVAAELQGHGRTADNPRAMTVPALAGDVAGLLDRLGIGRADVLGFSLGGMVALELALSRPERVRRLVLASVSTSPDGSYPETQPGSADMTSKRMPAMAEFAAMEADFRRVAPDPGAWPRIAAKASAMVGGFPGWPEARLRSLATPTLLLMGDTDFVRLEHAARLLEVLPDARLGVLPACKHMQVPHRTAEVLAMVEPFLDGPA